MKVVDEVLRKRNVIFLTKYGSHLYGTNTAASDDDMKGVFLPTKEEILLGKVPKTVSFSHKESTGEKNTVGDVDCELYSLNYFLELCASGQTVALELLWASAAGNKPVLHTSDLWDIHIMPDREKYITKTMKAFFGYARGQAVRYSLKGDKLNTAKRFRKILNEKLTYVKMDEVWEHLLDEFQEDDNVKFITDQNNVKMVEVCNRAIQESVTIKYAIGIIDKTIAKYGARSRQAAAHEGADFKAISHAIRIGTELKELYRYRRITFPSPKRSYLLDIKNGKYPVYDIMDVLDKLLNEVEVIAAQSSYPEKVDRRIIDEFVIRTYEQIVWGDSIY